MAKTKAVPRRLSRSHVLHVLAEAQNALTDYVERIEKQQGASLYYGRSVIKEIDRILREQIEDQ